MEMQRLQEMQRQAYGVKGLLDCLSIFTQAFTHSSINTFEFPELYHKAYKIVNYLQYYMRNDVIWKILCIFAAEMI